MTTYQPTALETPSLGFREAHRSPAAPREKPRGRMSDRCMHRAYTARVTDGRTENLLATTALALAERVVRAGEEATGLSAGAPAALVALSGFLSGQSVNALAHVL